ncbi:MAG: hypothetical protein ACRD52_00805 [Candidatus Acidiferrales bacterium]
MYRVQAIDGRGPWRPGFSKHWIDESSDRPLQADVLSAFGLDWRDEIPRGFAAGCACRSYDALLNWFTPIEQARLLSLGYKPVRFKADAIIRENEDQVIFAKRARLHEAVEVLEWPQPMVMPWPLAESVRP